MGFLGEVTEEYLGSLMYVKEIKREFRLPQGSSDITALIGPRRVGKTFIMLKSVENLIKRGEKALYIPFDEPMLRRMEVRKLAELVRREHPEGEVHLFLDEVQEWRNWDHNLRWLHDVKDFRLYVTGSSSALQSSEIPSRLRGRYISKLLLPLSFREVAGVDPKTFRERGLLRRLLDEYLKWGGFPEVWIYRSREKVISLLETMFYRDIVERFRVRNVQEFMDVFYFVLSNYSNAFTWNSLRRVLEGQGIRVDTKTLMSYVDHMRSAFLVFTVRRFSPSERVSAISPKKIYVVDTSFAMLFDEPMDLGRRMENLVFLELMRRGGDLFYYVTRSGREIDFLVRERGRTREVIEVCYDPREEHLKKISEALSELRLSRATIVTWDRDDSIEVRGRTIHLVPLWRWLLGDISVF